MHLEMCVVYWVGVQWLPGYPVPVQYMWLDYNFSEPDYIETHIHLSAKVKNEWSHTSSPLYVFMIWRENMFAFLILSLMVPPCFD